MLERLSEAAKQALERALEEARALGQEQIGTEHILLGMLGELEGIPVRALAALGAQPEAVRVELIRIAGAGGEADHPPRRAPPGESATPPSFTAWLAAALTAASAEASADERSIELTDLLLALVGDPQSPGGWVLAELGVEGERLRATAEHLRLLDREIERVGREMHEAAQAQQLGRAGELHDQQRQLIAQRQRRAAPGDGEGPSAAS